MNEKNLALKIESPAEPHRFTKRIGSTTFTVNVHFSKNTKETAKDKMTRLIRYDMGMGKAVCL